MPSRKAVTFSGKFAFCLGAQAVDPVGERGFGRVVEALDILVRQFLRESNRREPRAVQDLIRIGIANSAKQCADR